MISINIQFLINITNIRQKNTLTSPNIENIDRPDADKGNLQLFQPYLLLLTILCDEN